MSKVQHTVGPLGLAANPMQILDDYNGGKGPYRLIAEVSAKPCIDGAGNHTIPREEAEANAHRLVACWNACEGIPTKALGLKRAKFHAPHLDGIIVKLAGALRSALKTAEFERHPYRPWHQEARDALTLVAPRDTDPDLPVKYTGPMDPECYYAEACGYDIGTCPYCKERRQVVGGIYYSDEVGQPDAEKED